MATKIDNATAPIPKRAPSRPEDKSCFERVNQSSRGPNKTSRNLRRINHIPKINRVSTASIRRISNAQGECHKIAHSPIFSAASRAHDSLLLSTLADGHAMPSKITATPAASTKVEKLMDTLSARFATKRRQSKVTL
jgi:hypothetical protein